MANLDQLPPPSPQDRLEHQPPSPSQLGDSLEAVRLRHGHEQAVATVRERILALLTAAWNASPDLRDEDVDRLVGSITPLVETGQLAIARLTSVYLAKQATLLRGVPYSPAGVDRAAIAGVRGVPVTDVYRRPAVTVYTALSKGVSYEEARDAGLARLLTMAATDMQLAKTTQAAKSLEHSGAQLYRRTTTGKENCPICDLAAKHYYKTGDLAPIHDHCDCGVEEMPANGTRAGKFEDLSDVKPKAINPAPPADSTKRAEHVTASGEIRTADGSTREPEFTDLAVSEHGEIGPTLHWAQHDFTTVKDLPPADRPRESPEPAAKDVTEAPAPAKNSSKPLTPAQAKELQALKRKVAYQDKKVDALRRWEVARQASRENGRNLVEVGPDGYPAGYSAADHRPTAEFREVEATAEKLRAQLARKTPKAPAKPVPAPAAKVSPPEPIKAPEPPAPKPAPKAKPKTEAQLKAIAVLKRKIAYQAKKVDGLRRWEVARQATRETRGYVQIMSNGYPEGYSAADHKPSAEFRNLESDLATLRAQLARKTA